MKNINYILSVLVLSLFLLNACKNNNTVEKTININYDSLSLISLADTITYDVIVKPTDSSDIWTTSCLKHFDKITFIDNIFEDIYNNKLIAYDFFTNTPLSIKAIKELEKANGYKRKIIGKFQFNEEWNYNREKMILVKKVHSIIFGYETYDQDGLVKGYKPLFKVYFQ